MVDTVIVGGTTRTTRIDMSGSDTLDVQSLGTVDVFGNAQSVRFNGPTTNASVTNAGTIQNTAAGGRAIRIEGSVGANFTANFANTGLIQSNDDAFQIQAGAVTGGTITVQNSGQITSTLGQALDFAGGTGLAIQNITNSGGSISASANDAIRIGGIGTITNSAIINGGVAASFAVGADGIQFEDNSSGNVINDATGLISGDRHAINGGLGTFVTVLNSSSGGNIIGRNGSGVGLDGSGSIVNRGTISGSFSNSAGSDVNGSTIGAINGGGPDGINDGDGDGIDIDGQATVDNYGFIYGLGAGGTGSDGRPNTSEAIAAGGGIINNLSTGFIQGLGLGMLIDDSATGNAPFATTVNNDGYIGGINSVGIRIIGLQDDFIQNGGTIFGGAGIAIEMGGGNDTLRILLGSSITGVSKGEAGTDILNYAGFSASVTVNLATGSATGTGGVSGFENVLGSGLNDSLTGDGADNVFDGGDGGDAFVGGGGTDTVSYASSVGVKAVLFEAFYNTGHAAGDTYAGIANLNGSAFADQLFGDGSANVLDGGAASDVLFGMGGDDTLIGGVAGIGSWNQLWGGDGVDTASFAGRVTGVYADIDATGAWSIVGATYTLTDTFNSIENLTGSSNVDVLAGNSDSNLIAGGAGADQLYGRGGADIFVYDQVSDSNVISGYDTIADFVSGVDKLDISALSTDSAHVAITSGAASTKVWVEATAGVFNPTTDLAISIVGVNAVTVADIIF